MRIAIDAMGGDYAPQSIVNGARQSAAAHPDWEYLLVGLKEARPPEATPNLRFITCGSIMAMDEDVTNLIHKKDSSIWIATELVKTGQADAVISAGSTAAQMAAASLLLGRLKGVMRPAISTVLPRANGSGLLLDVGANADCDGPMLLQFAQMGAVYAETLQGKTNPRIALLANGTEDHKGNKLTREAFGLLRQSGLNFIGNREGRDMLIGDCDVLVADGMSGNIAVKSIEGAVSLIMSQLKRELTKSPLRKLGAALVRDGLADIRRQLDSQEYGGAPLLGVNGVSIVCHGNSRERAIFQACELAKKCIDQDFAGKIAARLEAGKADKGEEQP